MLSIILFVVWAGIKMSSEMVKNRPKSAKCALSMVLLGVAMATFVG